MGLAGFVPPARSLTSPLACSPDPKQETKNIYIYTYLVLPLRPAAGDGGGGEKKNRMDGCILGETGMWMVWTGCGDVMYLWRPTTFK
jgi:hypothetical protein